MSGKVDINERAVIERYEECETARIVAQEFGVSGQTIYRILERNGIQRTHRHPKYTKSKLVSNCRSKFCPSLIVMLRTVLNMNTSDISKLMNCNFSTVSNVIAHHGLQREKPIREKDVDIEAIEAEYIAGASTYELGEKYGVYHSTISKWMKKRGRVRGKGWQPEYLRTGTNKGHETQKQRAIEKLKNKLIEDTGGSIVLVEFCGDTSKFRCNDCGSEFSLWRDSRGYKISCPKCREEETKLRKEQREKEHEEMRKHAEQTRAEEYAKEKVCIICGKVFHSEYPTQNKCSDRCRTTYKIRKQRARERAATAEKQKAELKKDKICISCGCVFHSKWETKKYCDDCAKKQKYCDHKERAERYGVEYDSSITLELLEKRDGGICQICGEPCDWLDKRYGHMGPLYPSIDHIVAMANGGGHTWDNVQLAHVICNSAKRDLTEEELTEEVITHAKEQAIAHKCA